MLALTAACTHQAQLPAQSTALDTQADIFPDYRDIVIPANIAPLNFMNPGLVPGFFLPVFRRTEQ